MISGALWPLEYSPLNVVKRLLANLVTPHVIPSEARDLPAVAEIFEKHSSLGF
jgi:hypothetical protein